MNLMRKRGPGGDRKRLERVRKESQPGPPSRDRPASRAPATSGLYVCRVRPGCTRAQWALEPAYRPTPRRNLLDRAGANAERDHAMSVDLTSAIMDVKMAEITSRFQYAVAARMLRTANAQSQAMLQLVEAAAEAMDEAAARVAEATADLTGGVDVYA